MRELLSDKEKAIRTETIDNFVEKVKLKYLGVHPDELYDKYYPREICKQIEEIAEQLKEEIEQWRIMKFIT